MPEGSEDERVQQAVARLLRATMEFTKAYDAWSHSPMEIADRSRTQLERAEKALTRAQHDASVAQTPRRH